jgi:hypothetical protein
MYVPYPKLIGTFSFFYGIFSSISGNCFEKAGVNFILEGIEPEGRLSYIKKSVY